MPERNMKQDSKAQIEDLVALVDVYTCLIVVYTVMRTKGLDEQKTEGVAPSQLRVRRFHQLAQTAQHHPRL